MHTLQERLVAPGFVAERGNLRKSLQAALLLPVLYGLMSH